jgi:uncharacterized cupredoxin-like copper-binding protein
VTSWFVRAALAATIATAAASAGAADPTNVEVSMQDSSTASATQGMQMLANPSTIRAGTVTFHAANRSGNLVHEMLVVKVGRLDEKLPYDAKSSAVPERRIRKLGEISDLGPGKSGTLTLKLSPGFYLLLCNQPGHYAGGMWAALIVSR